MRFYVRLKYILREMCESKEKVCQIFNWHCRAWLNLHVKVPVDLRLDNQELRCAEDIRALVEACEGSQLLAQRGLWIHL